MASILAQELKRCSDLRGERRQGSILAGAPRQMVVHADTVGFHDLPVWLLVGFQIPCLVRTGSARANLPTSLVTSLCRYLTVGRNKSCYHSRGAGPGQHRRPLAHLFFPPKAGLWLVPARL